MEDWEQEREAQRAEILRQQTVLAQHSESLESRRSRLDQLRGELEATHRETLEMRIAVEEAWAQFTQEAGAEPAGKRFDAARAALVEHYAKLSESLAERQDEIAASQARLDRERQDLAHERRNLADWVGQREEQLRHGEQRLAQRTAAIESRDASGRSQRDDWTREKMNAERIIRDLLAQVAELSAQPQAEQALSTDE
jgi:chromosome segregation ATPase